ncbi:MAG: heavy-metal-associated domain-containing protein [Polaromonas sp.]|uniref:heavy-metal-associated domain-containing protein n=1 Tax=Polaromonas sp. TaxID=1869339 RepID=UPI0025F67BEA|nr:heavy metal-associated domain-containing protein [Polaromonas sp.]MBI2728468.1 heavy-metal-associated domain-containing protein [Polaromonas sp.]
MHTLKFDISGMSCGGCTGSVQRTLKKISGVIHAEVTLNPGVATVVTDPSQVSPAQIELAITSLGYPAKARPADQGQ